MLRDSETVITEILFAVGRIWSRQLQLNGLSVVSVGQFESAYDKEAIANSIYVRQIAPPISLLSTAILLTTPTLAQLP